MKKRLLFICFITFNLFSSSAFFSQTAKRENFFTSFGLGARAYVLKTPYVSMADDFAATHWNPGGVAFFDNFQLGAMHAKLSLNRQVGFISFIFPVDNSNKIGLSWKGLMINQIQGRTSNTILPDYLFSNIEQLFALTYSRRLWYNFGIGINMNFLHQSLDGVNAGGWGFDSGLLYKVSRNLNIGMVLYDFHSHLKWSTGQLDYFKKTGRLGFCYRLTQNSLFAIGMEGKNQFSASSEVQLMQPFALRMGWQDKFLSLGMGFNFTVTNFEVNVNYAVSNHKLTDELSHIVDLIISFETRNKIQLAAIDAAYLYVRSGPGFKYKKIAVVNKGQQFVILARKENWIKIKYSMRRSGWINEGYAVVVTT